jgi:putative hemolysin
MTVFLILLLIIFTFASGYFSASETSLFSISPIKIKTYRTLQNPRSRLIAQLLSNPGELLITILILNVCVNILVQNIAANLFSDTPGWGFKVGVPLALTLIFGEIVPKTLALPNNVKIAHLVAPIIHLAQRFLGPIRKVLSKIISEVSKILFIFLKPEQEIAKDEFIHILKTSEEHNVLDNKEASLIGGYLDLQDTTVRELMCPRGEVIHHNIKDNIKDLIESFVTKECSRIPIYEDEFDKIIGVISADIFFLHNIKTTAQIREYIEKPFFVPETMLAKILLQQLATKNKKLAIVVDEYGIVSGIITLEDIMEVVVGDIEDRRDQQKTYTQAGKNVIIASGKLEVDDFEDIFNLTIDNPYNMVTIGGWLTSILGDIPKSGSKHDIHGLSFQIIAATPTHIKRLYIRRK